MPTFIKQIERAFKEYPEGKVDDLCGMKTRVCVAIVEMGVTMTSVCHIERKSLNFGFLALVRAFSVSPDVLVPSRSRPSRRICL